jgi:hypothetical protein
MYFPSLTFVKAKLMSREVFLHLEVIGPSGIFNAGLASRSGMSFWTGTVAKLASVSQRTAQPVVSYDG